MNFVPFQVEAASRQVDELQVRELQVRELRRELQVRDWVVLNHKSGCTRQACCQLGVSLSEQQEASFIGMVVRLPEPKDPRVAVEFFDKDGLRFDVRGPEGEPDYASVDPKCLSEVSCVQSNVDNV